MDKETIRSWEKEGFVVSTDPALLDFDVITEMLRRSYWAGDRPRSAIEESSRNSLCFGVYSKDGGMKQVGFARAVTDHAVISFICDVIIAEAYRKQGLGKWLMACVLEHPYVAVTSSRLATADAHTLYERFGYVRREVMHRPMPSVPPPEKG